MKIFRPDLILSSELINEVEHTDQLCVLHCKIVHSMTIVLNTYSFM